MRRWTSRILIGVSLTGLAGCHTPPKAEPNPVVGLHTPVPQLASTERNSLEPDYDQLPTGKIPDANELPVPRPTYRAVTEREVQCFAVQASELGNLLDQENLVATAQPSLGRREKVQCDQQAVKSFQSSIRYWAAVEARNQSSAIALEMYFRLAEAEATADLLRESRTLLDTTITKAAEAKAKGIRLPIEVDELKRQRLEMEAQYAQAEIAIAELNIELKRRIGLPDSSADEHLWPVKDWSVSDQPIDVNAAVQIGLNQRAELNLLRFVLNNLDETTLPAARTMLGSINALLGSSPAEFQYERIAALLIKCRDLLQAEVDQRMHQLHQQLVERERVVAEDVRQAIEELKLRSKLVGLAKERYLNWKSRVEDVRERTKKGLASFLEESNAVLEWNKSRQEVVKEVLAYQRARVKLKQAQGLLFVECQGHH